MMRLKRAGFTLVEILVVIAVISILIAILLPVLATARAKADSTACLSNMHQIGLGILAYAQDYDDLFPYGKDPSDQYSNPWIWAGSPYASLIPSMPFVNKIVQPYTQSTQVWRCPADTGFDYLDTWGSQFIKLPARPTMFQVYGTSYLYRTEIGLLHKTVDNLEGWDPTKQEHGISDINVIMDANGSWHSPGAFWEKRYNVLMGDGHVVSQDYSAFNTTWQIGLLPPH